jgi:glycosyltransferase involved in cell wall biosynthesis
MSNIKFFKVILIERNHLDELKFYKNINDFIKKKIISFLMSITYKKADAVIGISQCLSNDLSKKIKKKVITIYSPAYDKKIFKLSDKKKPNIFNNKNEKYIINVSRFSKRKDQLTLLKAFSLIKDKIENLNLIMLGYGEEINNLKKYVQENNLEKKVYFIDKTLNPYPYIKNSDLFVLTSHYEGFPNVLVESLALRTPVISTNCNAGPKEILLNGKGGILININDHLNLSKKILSFFQNKNSLLKKMNYAIKKLYRFERKQHVVKYENLFNKL